MVFKILLTNWKLELEASLAGIELFDFRDCVVKFYIPFTWKIVRVNTAKNGGGVESWLKFIDDYRKDNVFRDSLYEFDLLEARFNEMVENNGDKLKSFF